MKAIENRAQNRQPRTRMVQARAGLSQAIDKARKNNKARRSGTVLAIIHTITGAVPFDAKAGVAGWGGARNRADRASDTVTLDQCENLIAAAFHADAIGLALNRHVTMHWGAAGIPDSKAAWATGRLLKLASDWITKRGGRTAYVWVRENGEGKGSHAHILLHVPAEMKPGRMMRGWLRSITGNPYRRGSIKTMRIGGTVRAWQTMPAVYRENLVNVLGYILKGASPAAAGAMGLERIDPGGRIIGKRVSTSRNTGRAARRRAGKC